MKPSIEGRLALNEPLSHAAGHMRHESGHYFWDRLIANSPKASAPIASSLATSAPITKQR